MCVRVCYNVVCERVVCYNVVCERVMCYNVVFEVCVERVACERDVSQLCDFV